MTAKNTKVQAGVCEEKAVSEFSKRRMTRNERLYRALLEPASAERFEKRPDWAHWYCVSVAGGADFAVESKLSKAGVEVFALREKFDVVKGGKKISAERPIFKGYLFVRILPLAEAFQALKHLTEIRDFLGDGTQYIVIPNEHMEIFQRTYEKIHVERMPVDKSIGQGNRAHITDGVFAGRECLVLQVMSGRNPKVRVFVEGFGEFARDVTLDLAFLRKL